VANALRLIYISDQDRQGTGFKKLAISIQNGYESEPMQAFVDDYLARKNGYLDNLAVLSH